MTRHFARCLTLACSAGALLAASGCYKEGGVGISNDTHVYVSTSHQPKTITLVDTRTGDAFWSQEVPVGKKLIVTFVTDGGTDGGFTPDLMQWGMVDASNTYSGRTDSDTPVPGRLDRRLDMELRPAPELPDDMFVTDASRSPVIIIEEEAGQ